MLIMKGELAEESYQITTITLVTRSHESLFQTQGKLK